MMRLLGHRVAVAISWDGVVGRGGCSWSLQQLLIVPH